MTRRTWLNLKFGVRIPNWTLSSYFPMYERLDYKVIVDYAVESGSLGYDSIWMNDHPVFVQAILESWTALSFL